FGLILLSLLFVTRPEQPGVTRYKVADACRWPSRDRLDIVGETIIPIGGMEPGHGQQVLEDMAGQIAAAKLPVPPFFEGHIDVGDGAAESLRIFRCHAMHVLGPRSR